MVYEKLRRIILRMLHIYRTYLAVKMIDRENDRLVKQAVINIKSGQITNGQQVNALTILTGEAEAAEKLSEKRVFFKKIGLTRAVQALGTARKAGYLQTEVHDGLKLLRVEHLKGLALIDGFFLFRPGLWKAWHEEHGWLLTTAISGAVITAVVYIVKHIWAVL